MPSTPTLTLCEQLVAALAAAWQPEAPSGVEWAFYKRFGDPESGFEDTSGRQVVIYPVNYDNGPETRGEDRFTHNITVHVAERYTGNEAEPPRDWVTERVDFVYDWIVQGFDYGREAPDWNPNLTTLSSAVTVCDVTKLLASGNLFFSVVELTFSELRSA
ncbi:hypothetical protein R5W24_004447 [Gemmata sp. JC717]|uniref:hypothetical protein n=1 Tax=Gemmata algarum TaxID=2975278 RepID=UPI0021BA6C63|nr:hypothetical protein [Gemmata algarum]MDY3555306.1 hypothetical protein [Gemmata algarum]